jgi:enoyl-[acyl-carrier protein] reductase II
MKAKDRGTVITGMSLGHPIRLLKNKLARQFVKLEQANTDLKELEALRTGRLKAAAIDGDINYGSIMAGQISGLVNDIKPATDIIQEIMLEAQTLLAGFCL